MSEQPKKPVVFSGIQPSGLMTIGNYIGAIRNWKALQEDYDCVYSVVDLHAITVRQEPAALRANTRSLLALLIACGVDPEKSVFFVQSHVPQHCELAWLLNCYTPVGELSRMTQFKDKSEKHAGNVNAGLLDYPVLMAADILLYQTDLVPVGADQKQHLEMSRNLAVRFNNAYSETFKVPEPYIPPVGARVMSLQDPARKMSKSDEDACYVALLDAPDAIARKVRRAVTDSVGVIAYTEQQPGVRNLIDILSAFSGRTPERIVADFAGRGYGDLKEATAEAVISVLVPIQKEHARLMADKAYLDGVMQRGALQAQRRAQRTLDKVRRKIGFVPLPR
nr:tryptophan--tRNA ligase [Maliibacterium massiliense]